MTAGDSLQTKRKVIRATVGQNLSEILGRTLVKDWYAAVSEFVCNSYDADAENVHVGVDKDRQSLEIIDDGSGMNERGLESFFRLGDSVKLQEPYSPGKHRRRVGKKGIAKTLLRFLGKSFSLETVCGGQKYVVDEGMVKGRYVSANAFPVSQETPSGTKITMRDLNFKIGTGFDVSKLCSRLQWDSPNRQDFDVFVNGRIIKKRGLVEFASVYGVDQEIEEGKRVTGRIYLKRDRTAKLEGVYICVNGRAVGDPSMFNLHEIDGRLVGHIQGEVNADFLEDLITLDRAKFQEDPRVEKVVGAVKKVLQSVVYDLDQGKSRRSYYGDDRLLPVLETALVDAQTQLNSQLNTDYEFELTGRTEAGPVARVDSEKNKIYLNAENRMFTFVPTQKPSKALSEIFLRRSFLMASAHAIAMQSSQNDGSASELLAEQTNKAFSGSQGIANVMGKFLGGRLLTPLDEVYLNACRLYDDKEVSYMTGRPALIVRLLHTSGALKGSEEHLFSRENLLQTLKPLEGKVSCIEVADPKYTKVHIQVGGHIKIVYENPKPTQLDTNLAREKLYGLDLINVGTVHPLHFVPISAVEQFRDYVKERRLYNETN